MWLRSITSAPLTLPVFPSKLATSTLIAAGIDPGDVARRTIMAESSGNPRATATGSSAAGLGQITEPTWLDLIRRHRPQLLLGRAKEELSALRFDPDLNRQMVLAYAEENAKRLSHAQLPITPARLYLMHFLGPGDALKILHARSDTPAASVVTPGALKSNGAIIAPRTAAQMLEWASHKMGVPPEPW
jgi:hypothetical protein